MSEVSIYVRVVQELRPPNDTLDTWSSNEDKSYLGQACGYGSLVLERSLGRSFVPVVLFNGTQVQVIIVTQPRRHEDCQDTVNAQQFTVSEVLSLSDSSARHLISNILCSSDTQCKEFPVSPFGISEYSFVGHLGMGISSRVISGQSKHSRCQGVPRQDCSRQVSL